MHILLQSSYTATCFGGGRHRHRPNNTATGSCQSCHAHIAIFRVRVQQGAVYVTTPTYGSVVLSALKMVVAATETCRHVLTLCVCQWCWTNLQTVTW